MIKLKDIICEGLTERNTYVAKSKIPGAGKGLFAARNLMEGELILKAKIQQIPPDEWKLLVADAPEMIKRYGYSWGGAHIGVPGKWWPGFRLTPDAKAAIAKSIFAHGFHEFNFINDNQIDPNVSEHFGNNEIHVYSRKRIQKGEELTKPYPWHGTATYDRGVRGNQQFDWWR